MNKSSEGTDLLSKETYSGIRIVYFCKILTDCCKWENMSVKTQKEGHVQRVAITIWRITGPLIASHYYIIKD